MIVQDLADAKGRMTSVLYFIQDQGRTESQKRLISAYGDKHSWR